MPDTITPNYSLVKPEVMGSIDTWGGKLNTNFDILDTEVKENESTGANSLKKAHADPLERTASNLLFYSTAMAVPWDQLDALTSVRAVKALINYVVPVGTVVMWAGAHTAVPAGWRLCTGWDPPAGEARTPNLTDRFVVAAGASWAVGAVGGTSALTHSARVSGTALDANTLPAHYHTIQPWSHTHNSHWKRTSESYGAVAGGSAYKGDLAYWTTDGVDVDYSIANIPNTDWAGASWAHDHAYSFSLPWHAYWPQFYALAFIMKVVAL